MIDDRRGAQRSADRDDDHVSRKRTDLPILHPMVADPPTEISAAFQARYAPPVPLGDTMSKL
jgi:hypothetical protein